MGKTEYVVLKGNDHGWQYIDAKVEATSAKNAIRAALQAHKEEPGGGDYVAVPVRSWKVQRVKVEIQQLLKIG